LDAAWNAVMPGAKKCYSEKVSVAAVGRIVEARWTVYKASEKYKVFYNTSEERHLISITSNSISWLIL
jgi:hypothetical protein